VIFQTIAAYFSNLVAIIKNKNTFILH